MAPHRRLAPERDGPSASSPRLASPLACLSAAIDPRQRFPPDPSASGLPLRAPSCFIPLATGWHSLVRGGEQEATGLIDLPARVAGWHFRPLIRLEHVPSVEPDSDVHGRAVPRPQSVSVFPCSHFRCPGIFPRSPPVDGLPRRRIPATGLALPLNHTVGVPNDALWLPHPATAGCGRRWAS